MKNTLYICKGKNMKGLRQSEKAGQMYKEIPKQVRNDNAKRMHKFSKGNI